MAQKFYDAINNRLVYVRSAADAKYWDNFWKDLKMNRAPAPRILPFDWLINATKKFLPKGALILEGGSGNGEQVYKLKTVGFNVIGIDYAKTTVSQVKKRFPSLDIRFGDVYNTKFKSSSFDGYWSLGVIEHYYNGYDGIILETKRILKKGGYMFITFPHMSTLRKIKTMFACYDLWKSQNTKDFYQFELDHRNVIKHIEPLGFTHVYTNRLEGLKGLNEESKITKKLTKFFQKINFMPLNAFLYFLGKALAPFSSHAILVVFRKK